MTVGHIPGRDVGWVMLYAISTCVWCKKTRRLLENLESPMTMNTLTCCRVVKGPKP